MAKQKKFIIANWKLNPITVKEASSLADSIKKTTKNTVVLCPPHIFLSQIKYPNLGAQDCFWEEKGHYTGQISPLQLKSLKVKYCIIGHSERRKIGETDSQINFKLKTLLEHGIIPVLCIGYGTTADEDDLAVVDILKQQLDIDLQGVNPSQVIVAYEPVWSISDGDPLHTKIIATPDHAEKIALYIKSKYTVEKVLYGGSANIVNAKDFLSQQHIDGLLVGAESLIATHFNQIIMS